MKNGITSIDVKFVGVGDFADVEAAPVGACERLVNLREKSGAMVAVGRCKQVGTLASGERIVAVHCTSALGRNLISVVGNELRWYGVLGADGAITAKGVAIATAENVIVAVEPVGDFLVVATGSGDLVARYDAAADGYSMLELSGLIPKLQLSASGKYALAESVPAYEFGTAMTHWQRPLAATDVERISANVADAYERLCRRAATEQCMVQPVLARYAVRLWNDSYAWVSAPLLIGNGIQSMAAATNATIDGEMFTGIEAASVSIDAYRVAVVAESGTDASLDSLVKSIDVLVTDEAVAVDTASPVDYNCNRSTGGGAVAYTFAFELPSADAATVLDSLLAARQWRVACSIYDLDALRQGRVVVANCHQSSNAADLPAGVHRYEIAGTGVGAVEAADIDRCVASSARRCASTAMCCHNRRLFAAVGNVSLRNSWHPSQFWHGALAATECRIVAQANIKTGSGMKTVVWQGTSRFTPSMLAPVVAYPDSRATSMTISILPAGGTVKRAEVALHSVAGCNVACSPTDDMQPLELTDTGEDTLPVPAASAVEESATGQLVEYDEGNPLVAIAVHNVCGSPIRAVAAVSHHTNDNIGTPLYAFADDGTYALPYRVATAKYSPAVVVSRQAIAGQVMPVGSDEALYFVTTRGDLCRMERYSVAMVLRGVEARHLAWNCVKRELWLCGDGGVTVLMQSGRTYKRNDADYAQLYGLSPVDAYASSSDGKLLDISREETGGSVEVELLTCPIVIADVAAVPVRVVWRLFAAGVSLKLVLNGENGASCHGMTLCRLTANGTLSAPIVMRLVSPPMRTVRLAIGGTMPAGAVVRQATVAVTR